MLDEVDALLVSQAGHHAHQGHICGQQLGLSSKPVQGPVLVAQSLGVPVDVCAYKTRASVLSLVKVVDIAPQICWRGCCAGIPLFVCVRVAVLIE